MLPTNKWGNGQQPRKSQPNINGVVNNPSIPTEAWIDHIISADKHGLKDTKMTEELRHESEMRTNTRKSNYLKPVFNQQNFKVMISNQKKEVANNLEYLEGQQESSEMVSKTNRN